MFSVALTHVDVNWSAVCDCGISWSYSLSFLESQTVQIIFRLLPLNDSSFYIGPICPNIWGRFNTHTEKYLSQCKNLFDGSKVIYINVP